MAAMTAGKGHLAIGGGKDGGAHRGAEIDALVHA